MKPTGVQVFTTNHNPPPHSAMGRISHDDDKLDKAPSMDGIDTKVVEAVHDFDADHSALAAAAARGRAADSALTLKQAFKSYKWAIIWSSIVSMNIVMESYDTLLLRCRITRSCSAYSDLVQFILRL